MPVSSNNALRLPPDFRKSLLSFNKKREVLNILREGRLTTVCEEARCPNIGECFSNKTATFMIMGDRCTRRCHFCAVTTKKPLPLNKNEPEELANAVIKMGLSHVVITSVDRDELPDFGASHFVSVVKAIKKVSPSTTIEVLTPDFKGRIKYLDEVLESPINVFSHNIESVSRLYKTLRPQSDFSITATVLSHAAKKGNVIVKTGMMVGVGESDEEVLETLYFIKSLGVQVVTIGQYLRPTRFLWPVHRYLSRENYERFTEYGHEIGLHVFAGPFVRSSYHAKETHLQVIQKN